MSELVELEVDDHMDANLAQYIAQLQQIELDEIPASWSNESPLSPNGSNVSRLSDALWGIRCLLEPEGDAGDAEEAEREREQRPGV